MLSNFKLNTLFAFAAVTVFCAPILHAEEYGSRDVSAAHVDDAKVKAFARAYTEVNQLHRQYELRLANATPDESAAVRQEAAGAMNAVVKKEGLTIDEYNSIARTMVTHPGVQERIDQEINSI